MTAVTVRVIAKPLGRAGSGVVNTKPVKVFSDSAIAYHGLRIAGIHFPAADFAHHAVIEP